MEKNNFYVTSYSAGIEYGCVTPFSCMNAVEHKNPGNANIITRIKTFFVALILLITTAA